MATPSGATMLRLAPTLKFGSSINAIATETMIILPPSEYFVTVPGFESPQQDTSNQMPKSISLMLESWTIDTTKNDPQYLLNHNFMFKKNGGTFFNAISILLQKNYAHNNLRILLHGGSSPKDIDNQLFFIDIDEENM